MKKTLKVAIAASVLTAPAFAANMENPLYMPQQGEVYSKTSAGVMYKKTDDTVALVDKDHDNANEFPIWRFQEDIGYGITDRLAVHGSFGYTKAGDIDRKGMHQGRVGMTYRMLEDLGNSVWDIYADAHLGGIGEMTGTFDLSNMSFQYDNYTNGRWGFHVGTRMGHTWGALTGMMFTEVLQTFGNANNEIAIAHPILGDAGSISVDLKSTTEFNAGIKTLYQLDESWSFGGNFTFKHHANNGVKGLSENNLTPAAKVALGPLIPTLLTSMANMEDGFDEYIIGASVANQLSEFTQVVLYGEYTMDTAQRLSQNGSDIKAEVGVRLNVAF